MFRLSARQLFTIFLVIIVYSFASSQLVGFENPYRVLITAVVPGAALLIIFFVIAIPQYRTTGWRETWGKVTRYNVYEYAFGGIGQTLYTRIVEYEYEVDGKTLVGREKFEYTPFIIHYPEGDDILVYYQPSEPTQSVMVRGIRSLTYILLTLALVYILLILYDLSGLIQVW